MLANSSVTQDDMKGWMSAMEAREINLWDQLIDKFMRKFFPNQENVRRRIDRMNFEQQDKTLFKAWGRYNRLIKACPRNSISECILMEVFSDGLNREM
ncbi:myb-like protein Z [Cucumis melo var. makuwa]|uniref:Myb-like protein Z n=1 Tax=Cucumis melo var. makuwa TaxID=1194695 RepID=A0A5D3CXI9_CUCMM|nr:myb-like protein Z [Cucumis melo var. makuwa]